MRISLLCLFIAGSALPLLGGQAAPVGVDPLKPEDVAKAIAILKENYIRRDTLSDAEMGRATLQGLLDRMTPGASLESGTASLPASPFYSEIVGGTTGYLRPGELNKADVDKTDAALKEWIEKGIGAVVLDLRGTPPSSDYHLAAELAGSFCAKNTELFSLESETPKGPQPEPFSANSSVQFKGILVMLVDAQTAEAPETIAASLRKCAKALVVGDTTAGRSFEYRDFPLDGTLLRVAVARVVLPNGSEPGENGLMPDINVGIGTAHKKDVMESITAKGVGSVIEEHGRAHLNEAALVSGSNPELDEIEQERNGKKPVEPLIDRQLQRALDLVTSITIYQSKTVQK